MPRFAYCCAKGIVQVSAVRRRERFYVSFRSPGQDRVHDTSAIELRSPGTSLFILRIFASGFAAQAVLGHQ